MIPKRSLILPSMGLSLKRLIPPTENVGILCKMNTVLHHSDLDFNKIHYIGLFSPKNKLGKVKNLYSQNFSKYEPLKSEGVTSRLAITFLLSLEKDALSCGNGNFQFQMNKKNLNKKKNAPPWTLFFQFFYIFPR